MVDISNFFFFFFGLLVWPHCAACGILVPQPGIEPVPPAVEAQSLNHWTAREVQVNIFFDEYMNRRAESEDTCRLLNLFGSVLPRGPAERHYSIIEAEMTHFPTP